MNSVAHNHTTDTLDPLSPTVAHLHAQALSGQYQHPDDTAFFANNTTMTPSMRLRWLMGRAVVRRAVTDILQAHDKPSGQDHPMYCISVHDGEDFALKYSRDVNAIMGEIGACDEETVMVRYHSTLKPSGPGHFFLVHGNEGWDVIADSTYSETMSSLLAGADALSETLGDQCHAQGTAKALAP